MAKCRISGDSLEYNLAKVLINEFSYIFYDTKSGEKFNKLKAKIINDDINLTSKTLSKLFQDLKLNKYNKIKFTQDNDGRIGNVSDFELYGNNEHVGFSLKKNNMSIKHPRPSAFYNQCNLNKDTSIRYKEDYMKCNNLWYEKIKNMNTFDKINTIMKQQLYIDFNNNTKKYLDNLSLDEISTFWNFLIQYECVYILKYDTHKKQIILYNYLNIMEPTKINSIEVKDNHIIIIFNNSININMRLHNASKNITKSLSLKYDTKILNHEKIFTQTIYKLSH